VGRPISLSGKIMAGAYLLNGWIQAVEQMGPKAVMGPEEVYQVRDLIVLYGSYWFVGCGVTLSVRRIFIGTMAGNEGYYWQYLFGTCLPGILFS